MAHSRRAAAVAVLVLVTGLLLAGPLNAGLFVVRSIYPGNWPLGVLVDSERGLVYVANAQGADVGVFETATLGQVTRIPAGGHAVELAVDPARRRLYVTNSWDRTLSVVDTDTYARIRDIPMPDLPHGLALDPVHDLVLVTSPHTGLLTVVDAATLEKTGTVPIPGGLRIDFDTTSGLAHVARYDGLIVVDPVTRTVVRNISTGTGVNDVVVDSARRRAYVSAASRDVVGIVDLVSNQLVADVSVGDSPLPLALDATTGLVYVGRRNGVDTVDPVTRSVVGRGGGAGGAFYMDVDESTHLVYATSPNDYRLFVLDDDSVPPESVIETPDLTVLTARSYYDADPVVGTATDDYSGISGVEVRFAPSGPRPPAEVRCDAPRRRCSWEAQPPATPGVYDVTVTATDLAGNVEAEPETVKVIVLPRI